MMNHRLFFDIFMLGLRPSERRALKCSDISKSSITVRAARPFLPRPYQALELDIAANNNKDIKSISWFRHQYIQNYFRAILRHKS